MISLAMDGWYFRMLAEFSMNRIQWSRIACRRFPMRLLLQDLLDAFGYGGPQYSMRI